MRSLLQVVAVLRVLALSLACAFSTQARVDVNFGPVEAALAIAEAKDPACGRQCRPWHLNQGHYFVDAPVCLVPMPCNAINHADDAHNRNRLCTAIQLLHTDNDSSAAHRPRCNCTYYIPEEPAQRGAFRLEHLDAPPPGATMFPGVGLLMHERYNGMNLWHAVFHYLPSIRMLQLFAERLQPRDAGNQSRQTERAQLVRIHDAAPKKAPWIAYSGQGNWTDEFYQLLPKFAQSLLVGDAAYVEVDKEAVQIRNPACYESVVAGHPPLFEWERHKAVRTRLTSSGGELPDSIEAYGPRDYDLMRAGVFELFGLRERSANLVQRMVVNHRNLADRRAFTNADGVFEVLSALGQSKGWQTEISTFVPGKTMAQQLTSYSKADIVVAAHGQGLAWNFFLPPGSIVVEILPSTGKENSDSCRGLSTYTNLNFAKAHFTGVMHFCFMHTAVVPEGELNSNWREHNIEVDTELLARQVSYAIKVTEEARQADCLYPCKRCANWSPNAVVA